MALAGVLGTREHSVSDYLMAKGFVLMDMGTFVRVCAAEGAWLCDASDSIFGQNRCRRSLAAFGTADSTLVLSC